jgi:flagellar M-ring protein FliF
VESVRVHLAEGEKSVFVRDNVAALRLGHGAAGARAASWASQTSAIVNLVAGIGAGPFARCGAGGRPARRLLSDPSAKDSDRLDLQARMEEKLRAQLAVAAPRCWRRQLHQRNPGRARHGRGDSARESYDKDGVVRTETAGQSQSTGPQVPAAGVPGALANTPPPATQASSRRAPATTAPGGPEPPVSGEARSSRTYELGREVSVANAAPGQGIKRLSVAVAISARR